LFTIQLKLPLDCGPLKEACFVFLSVDVQEKMAATGFEPVTKGLPIPWFVYKKVKQALLFTMC
jgi:hypothetical protein